MDASSQEYVERLTLRGVFDFSRACVTIVLAQTAIFTTAHGGKTEGVRLALGAVLVLWLLKPRLTWLFGLHCLPASLVGLLAITRIPCECTHETYVSITDPAVIATFALWCVLALAMATRWLQDRRGALC